MLANAREREERVMLEGFSSIHFFISTSGFQKMLSYPSYHLFFLCCNHPDERSGIFSLHSCRLFCISRSKIDPLVQTRLYF